jgi:hypothetical protein
MKKLAILAAGVAMTLAVAAPAFAKAPKGSSTTVTQFGFQTTDVTVVQTNGGSKKGSSTSSNGAFVVTNASVNSASVDCGCTKGGSTTVTQMGGQSTSVVVAQSNSKGGSNHAGVVTDASVNYLSM